MIRRPPRRGGSGCVPGHSPQLILPSLNNTIEQRKERRVPAWARRPDGLYRAPQIKHNRIRIRGSTFSLPRDDREMRRTQRRRVGDRGSRGPRGSCDRAKSESRSGPCPSRHPTPSTGSPCTPDNPSPQPSLYHLHCHCPPLTVTGSLAQGTGLENLKVRKHRPLRTSK